MRIEISNSLNLPIEATVRNRMPSWRKTLSVIALLSLTVFPVSESFAEWKFNESAVRKPTTPPQSKASRNSEAVSENEEKSDDSEFSARPSRVQVFGRGNGRPAPQEIAEDSASVSAPESGTDPAFESLRARIRSRNLAEGRQTADDAGVTREFPRSRPVSPAMEGLTSRSTTSASSAAIAPPPSRPMETEVVTPQKSSKPVDSGSNSGAARGTDINPAFPYTHLLPGPSNLPRGEWNLGSTVAYGVADFLEVSTNVARTFLQHWNLQIKSPLIEYPTFIASATLGYESYNPHNIDRTNADMRINRWQPGIVTGYEITDDMAFFVGGNFNFGKDPIPVRTTSGYMRGARIEVDWSWLYNPSDSRLGDNAISAGVSYDTTYSLLGFGFTHHWQMFDLGIHYTLADRNRFLPIFGFSANTTF